MSDQSNVRAWMRGPSSVEWKTAPPLRQGSKLECVFEGESPRRVYLWDVADISDERLALTTITEGNLRRLTFTWRSDRDTTTITINRYTELNGSEMLMSPLMGPVMRRGDRKRLRSLKAALETSR
jgi:hypothetical protein